METNNQKITVDGKVGTQWIRRDQQNNNSPGDNRYLDAGQEQQGVSNICRIRLKKQARDMRLRDKRRRLEGGGCRRSPGRQRTKLGEEVGSGCTDSEATTTDDTHEGEVIGRRSIV